MGATYKIAGWLLGVVCLSIVVAVAEGRHGTGGIWSVCAKKFPPIVNKGDSGVRSPDGMESVVYTTEGVYLYGRGKRTLLPDVLALPPLAEVLWRNDSRAFVITGSDGGIVGTWKINYYQVAPNGMPKEINVERIVMPALKSFAHCDDEEAVNIGAAGWINGGKDLLVIAQVPPHSTCRNMGAITGVTISLAHWRIKARVTEATLLSKWKRLLGSRFASLMQAETAKKAR